MKKSDSLTVEPKAQGTQTLSLPAQGSDQAEKFSDASRKQDAMHCILASAATTATHRDALFAKCDDTASVAAIKGSYNLFKRTVSLVLDARGKINTKCLLIESNRDLIKANVDARFRKANEDIITGILDAIGLQPWSLVYRTAMSGIFGYTSEKHENLAGPILLDQAFPGLSSKESRSDLMVTGSIGLTFK